MVELDESIAIFGVMDGHGGPEVANYVRAHAVEVLKATDGYQNNNFPKALQEMNFNLDANMQTEEGREEVHWFLRNQPIDET